MKQSKDTYGEPQIIEYPNMIVRVYRPILDDAEREKRMKLIRHAAENILKGGSKNEVSRYS